MTTKTVSFDPIPDGGDWSIQIGFFSTGDMDITANIPASIPEEDSIQGRLREEMSLNLTVTGDLAGGFSFTYNPSHGSFSADGSGLYKLGGDVTVARVRGGENGYDGVREQQAIEVMGDSGSWDLGQMSIPHDATAAAVEVAVEMLTQQGVSVEKVGATFYTTWDEPGPRDMLPASQGSMNTFSHQQTAAGEYPTPGITEVQTITLPACVGGEWDLDANPLPHDASAEQVDTAVTSAQVTVTKSGNVYTVTWTQPGPRELLPCYGSNLHVAVNTIIS
jgi:hypothetical protein